MPKTLSLSTLFVLAVSAVMVHAQPQIEVLSLEEPEWNWGSKAINITVYNGADYIRFIVIKSTFESHGEDGVWQIQSRFSTHLPPATRTTLAPVVSIPGNYGPAKVNLTFYDVVDTMDIVLPDQLVLDTTFHFTIDMPDEARKWVEQRLILPPRFEQHPYFDDQYSRMMLQFINAGVTIEEMARIAGCEGSYIRSVLHRLRRHGLARLGETAIEMTFPYISGPEAEACLPLANRTAGLLADAITRNLAGYDARLDSLIGAGVVPDDRDNLISGTMVLYQPYIVVSAMLLWYDLGGGFVTDGKPLQIYEGTDICNAANRNFTYALEADDSLSGRHFFALLSRGAGDGILFADHDPALICSGNYPARPGLPTRASYTYREDDRPEFYFLDTSIVRPVLDGLGKGTGPIVDETHVELAGLAGQYGRTELRPGYKYWFWNLVATKTLDLLTERQVLQGSGANNFQLGSVAGMQ